jgi:phospholipid/cholesterol/gamma-HCH transport system ATP-binding protein
LPTTQQTNSKPTAPSPDQQVHGARVRMEGVCKSFGTAHVLRGVDLDVPPGSTTVVLGPSGSGKSVLLRLLVGLLPVDEGRIWFDDTRVDNLCGRDLDAVRTEIGFLFQLSALFDSMTVAENLAFPLMEHTALTKQQRAERIHQNLARVDMLGSEAKYPAQLSGGQQRRIAFARAVMLRPRLVLYDEPTTGLDPVRAKGINTLINRLKQDLGVTGLVVTHDLQSVRAVADQVVILLDGRVRIAGTCEEVMSSTDPAVRGFLTGEADESEHHDHADSKPRSKGDNQ